MPTDVTVNEDARKELLHRYAWCRDHFKGPYDPTGFPLWLGPYRSADDDILLALSEAVKLGQMERGGKHPNGPCCRITDAGYAWIRANPSLLDQPEQRFADA